MGISIHDPTDQLNHDLIYSSGGSLCVLLWEWAITFESEVDIIWQMNRKSWLKWTFLFARYFPIPVQICNRALDIAILYDLPLKHAPLRVWYVFQVLVAGFSVFCLEIVLMSRVFALYNKNQWILITFACLVMLEVIAIIVGLALTLPDHDFDPIQMITRVPTSFAYFGIAAVVVQSVIIGFTIAKCVQSHLKSVPIVKFMIRDGTYVFILLCMFSMILVIYTLRNIAFSVTGYAWLLTMSSSACCRSIVNMQLVPQHPASTRDTSTEIQFTTIIYTDQIDRMTAEEFSAEVSHRSSSLPNTNSSPDMQC
ncbi:hypothetical protein BDQ12DRAFT_673537 [Crucibulum laeve]|uniref:DUF6533 domain-containing protein n=1 Tax=Crucibulum laeve TaxID=68775 RepID=A0A5C3MJC1_9AGAR|nr:hypothetical protein BDQ12DRAFT_673537 [Crucibulum laeve]